MSAKKHLSEEQKRIIYALHLANFKGPAIAERTGMNVKTIYNVIRKGKQRGTTDRAKGSGRSPKMTPRIMRTLNREVVANKGATLAELTASLPVKFHCNTVRIALHKLGYHNRVVIKKS